MSRSIDRVRRILTAAACLKHMKPMRTKELAGLLDEDEKRLKADLALLTMTGVPPYSPADLVEVDFSGGRIRLGQEGRLGETLSLTTDEMSALAAGICLKAHFDSEEEAEEVRQMLTRMADAAGRKTAAALANIIALCLPAPEEGPAFNPDSIEEDAKSPQHARRSAAGRRLGKKKERANSAAHLACARLPPAHRFREKDGVAAVIWTADSEAAAAVCAAAAGADNMPPTVDERFFPFSGSCKSGEERILSARFPDLHHLARLISALGGRAAVLSPEKAAGGVIRLMKQMHRALSRTA